MKMKKILFCLSLIGIFAAIPAKGDSVIYWMADVSSDAGGNAAIRENSGGFHYANLIAKDGSGNVVDLGWAEATPSKDGGTLGFETAARIPSESMASYTATDYQNWTYYVELWNEDWNCGTSSAMYWADISEMDAFYKSTLTGGLGVLEVTSFTYNAPEPTSGLLILLGMCGLALKRKRV